MSNPVVSNAIRWGCRRGMLELDLLLNHFLQENYGSLSSEEQGLFARLLEQPDPLLLEWLIGEGRPDSQEFGGLIDTIREMGCP